jgi:hypothetical protein
LKERVARGLLSRPTASGFCFFLEIWPDGPTGHSKQNLWEIGIDGGGLRKIADFGLFDDPLHWKTQRGKGRENGGRSMTGDAT